MSDRDGLYMSPCHLHSLHVAGEMAQQAQDLPCANRDLSLIPRNPHLKSWVEFCEMAQPAMVLAANLRIV